MEENSRDVTGTLITIGDEILFGDIPNGNAHYIATGLRSKGFLLSGMIVVGDEEEKIASMLKKVIKVSDFVIATGGLGPTDDDRTSDAVAKALERPLEPDTIYAEWLKKRLAERGAHWTPEIARMARLPRGARKIGLGMAGYALIHNGVPCYFLPGVPHEMKWLMENEVLPDLQKLFPSRRFHVKHRLRFHGLTESTMNRLLKDLAAEVPEVRIGYLPQIGENWITLFASGSTEEEAHQQVRHVEEEVIARLGSSHLVGRGDVGLPEALGILLRARGWKISVAESCTGGLLSRKITGVAGASDYFERGFITYSNASKSELLGVPESLILEHGAVSEAVATAMADGARRRACADGSLAVTGIAGPSGGSREKPVGTVFIGCSTAVRCVTEKHLFSGSREHIQECAAQAALALLWRVLSHDS